MTEIKITKTQTFTNKVGEAFVRNGNVANRSYLDGKNINWKVVDDKWIGKRSVWTKDNRACWLEDTTPDNIKSYWCGVDADYTEIFTND